MAVKWFLLALIWISLVTSEDKHLFKCLLSIQLPILWITCLCVFPSLSFGVVFLFYKWFFFFLYTDPFLSYVQCSYLPPVFERLFIFWYILLYNSLNVSRISFWFLRYVFSLRNPSLPQDHKVILLYILLKFLRL